MAVAAETELYSDCLRAGSAVAAVETALRQRREQPASAAAVVAGTAQQLGAVVVAAGTEHFP